MTQGSPSITATTKLVVLSWMALCATGMWQLSEHASSPGTTGEVLTKMPRSVAARLHWSFDKNLLVLAVHPQCPCLPASLDELEAVLASDANLTLRILAYEPTVRPPEWNSTARDQLLKGLPQGTVIIDKDGALAAQLGATTSGHINAYQQNGDLIFAGGITGSRGHRGDNQNRHTLQEALRSPPIKPARTLVFGCPLQSPCNCPQ